MSKTREQKIAEEDEGQKCLDLARACLRQSQHRLGEVEAERDALAKRLDEAEMIRETFLHVLVALASSKTIQEAAANLEALKETLE